VNPDSIKNKNFRKAFRGFRTNEVATFLEEVTACIEALQQENAKLRYDTVAMEEKLQSCAKVEKKLERMLQEMEATSSRILEQTKMNAATIAMNADYERKVTLHNAKAEAGVIVADAEKRADRILAEAQKNLQIVIEDIGILNTRRMTLVARIKSLLSSQTEFLELVEKENMCAAEAKVPLSNIRKSREGLGEQDIREIIESLEQQKGNQT